MRSAIPNRFGPPSVAAAPELQCCDRATPILNLAGQLTAERWYHVVPKGDYPHAESGSIQVIDDPALDAMINNFKPKLFVGPEHFFYDSDKSTEAYGWATALQKRDDGLWARIDWTDFGEAAVSNGRYRYVSPTWLGTDVVSVGYRRVRPLRIDTIGLTNNPNLRGMTPLSNREPRLSDVNLSEGDQRLLKIAGRAAQIMDAGYPFDYSWSLASEEEQARPHPPRPALDVFWRLAGREAWAASDAGQQWMAAANAPRVRARADILKNRYGWDFDRSWRAAVFDVKTGLDQV